MTYTCQLVIPSTESHAKWNIEYLGIFQFFQLVSIQSQIFHTIIMFLFDIQIFESLIIELQIESVNYER